MPKLTTALLNQSIDIERLSGTDSIDDRGNISTSFSSSSSSVQARILESKDNTEVLEGNLEVNNVKLRVLVPADTDVTTRDRLSFDSRKWNIIGIKNKRDRFGNIFYKQLVCESGY